VIAAIHRDLQSGVDAGTFRRYLFFRLNVFPIHIPPLRERKDDIPLLVEYLTDRYAKKPGTRSERSKKGPWACSKYVTDRETFVNCKM